MVKRRLFSFLFWLVKCYFGTGFSYASLWIRGEWYDFSWPITEHQSVANLKAMYTFDTLETEFVSLLSASPVENVWCAFPSAMEEDFLFKFPIIYLALWNSSQVEEVRRSTRNEKKKLAMAMREKQLGALGMQVNIYSSLICKYTADFQLRHWIKKL